jgi:hypothetical protein
LDKYGMKNRVLALVLVLAIISLIASSLAVAIIAPSSSLVFAADLTNVTDTPLNPAAKATATHIIAFTTATEGDIKYVDIVFQAGFDVSSPTLVSKSGIGDGSVALLSGQTVRYTVDTPETIATGTAITIALGNIQNAGVGSYTVTVTTKDSGEVIIDGPTHSAPFDITPAYFTVVTQHDGTETAGTAFNVTITALDALGATTTGYSGPHTISFSSTATSAPNGTLPTIPTTQVITFTAGVGNSSTSFILTNAGQTPTITAQEGAVSGTSAAIAVNPGPFAAYTVTSTSYTQTVNVAFDVTVTACDEYENPVTTDPGAIWVCMSSSSYTMVFDANGDGDFGNVTSTDKLRQRYINGQMRRSQRWHVRHPGQGHHHRHRGHHHRRGRWQDGHQ